jgi:hypothetical protein
MEFLNTINDQEKKFFQCLQQVRDNSLWGIAIVNVVKNPDVPRFRRLVCDLKSQAHDNSEVMVAILGQQCFDNLISL